MPSITIRKNHMLKKKQSHLIGLIALMSIYTPVYSAALLKKCAPLSTAVLLGASSYLNQYRENKYPYYAKSEITNVSGDNIQEHNDLVKQDKINSHAQHVTYARHTLGFLGGVTSTATLFNCSMKACGGGLVLSALVNAYIIGKNSNENLVADKNIKQLTIDTLAYPAGTTVPTVIAAGTALTLVLLQLVTKATQTGLRILLKNY